MFSQIWMVITEGLFKAHLVTWMDKHLQITVVWARFQELATSPKIGVILQLKRSVLSMEIVLLLIIINRRFWCVINVYIRKMLIVSKLMIPIVLNILISLHMFHQNLKDFLMKNSVCIKHSWERWTKLLQRKFQKI